MVRSESDETSMYCVPTPTLSPYRTRSGLQQDKTSQMKSLYLVHPWLDALLGQDDAHSGALVEDDAPPPSADTDDGEISDEEFDDDISPLPEPELPSHAAPEHAAPMDDETPARRFVARLRRPFGALLLTLVTSSRRGTDYRRVVGDSLVTVQFQESVSLGDILDNMRTLYKSPDIRTKMAWSTNSVLKFWSYVPREMG